MQDYERAAAEFAILASELALSVKCDFVPFSQSRNKGEDRLSLNWRCTVERNGRAITGLEAVDYMQGSGHCPASKAGGKRFAIKADMQRAIALECETGKRALPDMGGRPYQTKTPIAPPTAADVLSALWLDSDVIDYACFEDWAADLGYDPDSRKGEATYRACLATALALRSAIGEADFAKLRDLAREM